MHPDIDPNQGLIGVPALAGSAELRRPPVNAAEMTRS
jgi:hypothetical protein